MANRSDIETFVTGWVAQNNCAVPGGGGLAAEIDRLASALTAAARARGISGGEIHRVFGDNDDYLTGQYRPA